MTNKISSWYEYLNNLAQKKGFKNHSEYVEKWAKEKGYKNSSEYKKEWQWNKGVRSPMSENDDCPQYLGIHMAERNIAKKILSAIYKDVEDMPYRHQGFDFICDKKFKIDIKSARLIDGQWQFQIRYNNIADYFMLIGFNNEKNGESELKCINIWWFKNDNIIRGKKFWRREGFYITNKPYYLSKINIYTIKNKLRFKIEDILI